MRIFFLCFFIKIFSLCGYAQNIFTLNTPLPDDFINGIEQIDKPAEEYQFFMTSEIHGVKEEVMSQWAFVKYLHKKAGLQSIILERSYSIGYMINLYFEEGDERFLNGATNFEEDRIFFQKLYHYNQTLPKEKQIFVLGIDAERFRPPLVNALKIIIANHRKESIVFDSLYNLVDEIVPNDDKKIMQLVNQIKSEVFTVDSLMQHLGKDSLHLQRIVNNPGLKGNRIKQLISEKEKYEHIINWLPNDKNKIVFSQYGATHTHLNKAGLVKILNEELKSPFQNKVLSIGVQVYNTNSSYGGKEIFHESLGSVNKRCGKKLRSFQKKDIELIDTKNLPPKFKKLKRGHPFILLIRNGEEMSYTKS